METKICKDCKIEFPKTDNYFYKKSVYKNKIYFCNYCKSCDNINKSETKSLKRANELNISLEEYKLISKKLGGLKRKYELTNKENLQKYPNHTLYKAAKLGYNCFDKYKQDTRKKISDLNKQRRKYNYSTLDNLTNNQIQKIRIKNLAKSYVANSLNISVLELTDELYNLRKNQILLTRKIKENEKSTKICN